MPKPVIAFVTMMLPPSVKVPEPVILEPVTAPSSKDKLVGEPNVNDDNAKVALLLTDKEPPTVKFADNVVVPIESFKLLKEVNIVEGNVLLAVSTTVPIPLVNTFEPELLAKTNPLQTSVPPLVIINEPLLLVLLLCPKVTFPEATNFEFALNESVAVPEDVGDKFKAAQTAVLIFTTTDWPPVKVTDSKLVGKVLLFQLLASPQLEVPASPSQIFWA